MFLDLEVQETGEWFAFFGSHIDPTTGDVIYDQPVENGARVKIRSMGPFIEERLAKRKMEVERVLNPKTRAMERLRYYPEQSMEEILKEREDTYDYAIMDFENFKDKNTKKVIECTRENKTKMMKIPVFDRFVARCLQTLGESGVQEAVETANLKNGSSSPMTKLDPE